MLLCKKCGAVLAENAAFCPKCGAPVDAAPAGDSYTAPQAAPAGNGFTPPAAPVPPTPDYGAPMTPPPQQKSKKPLIIGIIIAVIAVVVIGCFALGAAGGGGDSQIVGKWDLTATIDGDDVTPISRGLGYIEFKSNGTVTLSLGDDATYSGTYEKNDELASRVDGSKGAYDVMLDSLPDGVASISEIQGEDGLFLLIPGVQYGMFFQK